MPYHGLRDFIDRLERSGRLVRVAAPVLPNLEITEIQTRLLTEGGPAALFENVDRSGGASYGMPAPDFGAGSGLVPIAAAKAGACPVTAASIDPFAGAAIQVHAILNGAEVAAVTADLVGAARLRTAPLIPRLTGLAESACFRPRHR